MSNTKKELIVRDWLAIERTKLANERTFLAYFRSAFVLLASGLTLLKVSYFAEVDYIGWVLIILAPIVLGFGLFRLIRVKKWIEKHYN